MEDQLLILHPLFVHLHIAFLVMAFAAMAYWLVKGLTSSVFEDRIYRFARVCTALGVFFVALSMAAGLHDALRGALVSFQGVYGGWIGLKALLALLLLVIYGTFLRLSARKPRYLQEDPRLLAWCLGTQVAGFAVVVAITTIGTMLVYYRTHLPPFPLPW